MTLKNGIANFIAEHNQAMVQFINDAVGFVTACPNTTWRTNVDAKIVHEAWARGYLALSKRPGLVVPGTKGIQWFLRITPNAHILLDAV